MSFKGLLHFKLFLYIPSKDCLKGFFSYLFQHLNMATPVGKCQWQSGSVCGSCDALAVWNFTSSAGWAANRRSSKQNL